ncbi:MAG: hypothetical protein J0L72_08930 [Armatimonadetes bacterium]|nr:hypothetical protein [Armatimonadota bacterium]
MAKNREVGRKSRIPSEVLKRLSGLKSEDASERAAIALIVCDIRSPWSAAHVFEAVMREDDNYTFCSMLYSLAENSPLSASLAAQTCLNYRDADKKFICMAVAVELGLMIPEAVIEKSFNGADWALKLLLLTYCLKSSYLELATKNLEGNFDHIVSEEWEPISSDLDVNMEAAWLTSREFAKRYFENIQFQISAFWDERDGEN